MHPVCRYPFLRRVLYRHCRKSAQGVFKPLRSLEAPVRQQAVPTKSHTETTDDPVADQQCGQVWPAKCEERRDSKQMKGGDYRYVLPVDSSTDSPKREDIFHGV